jgi:hypothetical protein
MVFGKKKLKPHQLAPPAPPKAPATHPDAKAPPPPQSKKKPVAKAPPGDPNAPPRNVIESLEDRQHI